MSKSVSSEVCDKTHLADLALAGIGTYVQGDSSRGLCRYLRSFFSMSLNKALGLSLQHHVHAGYRFIMRHYSPGDYIYIIGFSGGAYTAQFLAEMVDTIGLLSRDNEEMVHIAWKTFSNFQTSREARDFGGRTEKDEEVEKYVAGFKKTFCSNEARVHFLGLFDCVDLKGQFDFPLTPPSYQHIPASNIVKHSRHAGSINERRIKFKPALFNLKCGDKTDEDVKEVWFAGTHGCIDGSRVEAGHLLLEWRSGP